MESSREILDILARLNRDGMTIMMVTHDSEVAAYASRQIMLQDGRILFDRATASHVPVMT